MDDNLTLVFSKAGSGRVSKGPFRAVRFEGDRILDLDSGRPVAEHLPYGWRVDGEDYLRLDVEGSARVTWEGFSGAPSTTGHLSCVNGVAYIDRRILAFADRERNDWYLVREGQHQAVLVVRPA